MEVSLVELESDHPGFHDLEYRKRRDEIARLAMDQQAGDPIPRVEYTAVENSTWSAVHEGLSSLYARLACAEFNEVFAALQYPTDRVPQIADVDAFLQRRTGFRMQPVAGLVSAREFLGALSRRVFCSTQYIRYHSKPLYTPEPDVCHELMGHAPMLAIPEFADLSQKIGEGARDATDEQIEQLATLYWFTVEYGVVRQNGELKAYGAGLLSSFGEIEHALSGAVEIRPFDADEAAVTAYPITTYQPLLFEVGTIGEAFEKMADFVRRM